MIMIQVKNKFLTEKTGFSNQNIVVCAENFVPVNTPDPCSLLRVRVFQGYRNLNPYPYPHRPYPQPMWVWKPLTITSALKFFHSSSVHPVPQKMILKSQIPQFFMSVKSWHFL